METNFKIKNALKFGSSFLFFRSLSLGLSLAFSLDLFGLSHSVLYASSPFTLMPHNFASSQFTSDRRRPFLEPQSAGTIAAALKRALVSDRTEDLVEDLLGLLKKGSEIHFTSYSAS